MPKIQKYEQDSVVSATDKVLGTDSSGATKNYTLTSIANHYRDTNAINTITNFTWLNDATGTVETGEIQLNNTAWASVTSMLISKYLHGNIVGISLPT